MSISILFCLQMKLSQLCIFPSVISFKDRKNVKVQTFKEKTFQMHA